MSFPLERPRRLRRSETLRRMIRETKVTVDDLILPLFVVPGENVRDEISSMPGNFHLSVDQIVEECRKADSLGIPAVILFGIPESKDEDGSEAFSPDAVVPQAIWEIKSNIPNMVVITDVCLCEYMSHGHCGIVVEDEILNDPTLDRLAEMAAIHADSGADIVAPSDMMDGRVVSIRQWLDEKGHADVAIMSYAVKYASAFYGPFREAANSAPSFGDRKGYQMDPGNSVEAVREIRLDLEEGADIVMVKPALPYLDILRKVRESTDVPVAAYNVSGEFAMIKAAADRGWLDYEKAMLESLTSIKRAGADMILTYFASDAAKLL